MSTILVIEDNVMDQEIVKNALEAAGYKTLLARDGETGLRMARESRPDLILCDIDMPGMNGFETLKELGKDPQTRSLPFVFLTGSSEAMSGQLGRQLGADEFIEKPFSFSKLLAIVSARTK